MKGKLKRHREQQPKNNTVKKVKLEDIFSERVNQSDGFPRERILDKFISDLVRYKVFNVLRWSIITFLL